MCLASVGIEPPTFRFEVVRLTNWAIGADGAGAVKVGVSFGAMYSYQSYSIRFNYLILYGKRTLIFALLIQNIFSVMKFHGPTWKEKKMWLASVGIEPSTFSLTVAWLTMCAIGADGAGAV